MAQTPVPVPTQRWAVMSWTEIFRGFVSHMFDSLKLDALRARQRQHPLTKRALPVACYGRRLWQSLQGVRALRRAASNSGEECQAMGVFDDVSKTSARPRLPEGPRTTRPPWEASAPRGSGTPWWRLPWSERSGRSRNRMRARLRERPQELPVCCRGTGWAIPSGADWRREALASRTPDRPMRRSVLSRRRAPRTRL